MNKLFESDQLLSWLTVIACRDSKATIMSSVSNSIDVPYEVCVGKDVKSWCFEKSLRAERVVISARLIISLGPYLCTTMAC
jgi:hypothetical protein